MAKENRVLQKFEILFAIFLIVQNKQLPLITKEQIDTNFPEQIHLSLTGKQDQMVVMWMTPEYTNSSVVKYGISKDNLYYITNGEKLYNYHFNNPWGYTSPMIHVAILPNLNPDTKYYYICGDNEGGYSSQNWFITAPSEPKPFTFIAIGDNGHTENAVNVINAIVKDYYYIKPYDMVVSVGDLSYADGYQPYWDDWGRILEPISKNIPYMTCVGNHEAERNEHLPFLKRLRMPANESNSDGGNLWFSFDYSYAHFIMISSEDPYLRNSAQYNWIKSDVKKINRKKTPWFIVVMHRPWYNSNQLHQYEGEEMRKTLEPIFYPYNVDLYLTGHVHAYERTHAIYDFKMNHGAPVHMTIGTAGTHEGLWNHWIQEKPVWSAFRSALYWGFNEYTIFNETHFHGIFRDSDNLDHIVDQFWLIKHR